MPSVIIKIPFSTGYTRVQNSWCWFCDCIYRYHFITNSILNSKSILKNATRDAFHSCSNAMMYFALFPSKRHLTSIIWEKNNFRYINYYSNWV